MEVVVNPSITGWTTRHGANDSIYINSISPHSCLNRLQNIHAKLSDTFKYSIKYSMKNAIVIQIW